MTTETATIKVTSGNLAAALKAANAAAEAALAENATDGGTCNLDGVMIRLPRVRQNVIEQAAEASGVEIGYQWSGWMWKGYRCLSFVTGGQGDLRTRMAEAAFRVMRDAGFDVRMYYQMD